MNKELTEDLNNMDVVQGINILRLDWVGHVAEIEVSDAEISGRQRRGRPFLRWTK